MHTHTCVRYGKPDTRSCDQQSLFQPRWKAKLTLEVCLLIFVFTFPCSCPTHTKMHTNTRTPSVYHKNVSPLPPLFSMLPGHISQGGTDQPLQPQVFGTPMIDTLPREILLIYIFNIPWNSTLPRYQGMRANFFQDLLSEGTIKKTWNINIEFPWHHYFRNITKVLRTLTYAVSHDLLLWLWRSGQQRSNKNA